jgi:heterodisulfide reductase subunit C
MSHAVAAWIALALFGAALVYKVSLWFRHGLASGAGDLSAWSRLGAASRGAASTLFSSKILTLLKAFLFDVLLQGRLRKESRGRWIAHLFVSGAFVLLLLMHALGQLVTARLFPSYASTLNPYLFLREVLGALLAAGLILAAYRRYVQKVPRRVTSGADSYALAVLGVILVSGLLLEATKIGSYSAFQAMVEQYGGGKEAQPPLEAYWVSEMGTVSPNPPSDVGGELRARGKELHEQSCAPCHSAPQSAFMGYATASLLRPASSWLDGVNAPVLLWTLHFFGGLVGLVLLPFTKLFHILATPLSLAANAVMSRERSLPANLATKQMIELDACTHCCTCSAHCSMAMASASLGNLQILPSERVSALKALASGNAPSPPQLRTLQQGVCVCTSCDRCTVACPSGIDVLGLWLSAKETLVARGEPAYALLSPLSFRRAAMRGEIAPAAYLEAVERPRRAIADRFGWPGLGDPATPLSPGGEQLWSALHGSVQASTFSRCFGCKTCSTACPVVRNYAAPQQALGLLPHQIMYAARLRLWGLVLGSKMLWDCLGCYQCQEHCPQGVGVTDVIYQLKNVAIANAMAGKEAEMGVRP